MGWLQRRRERKCERTGHRVVKQTRRTFVMPSTFIRSIADRVVEERQVCARCHVVHSDWVEVDREWISSLSLPSEDMETLRRTGRLARAARHQEPEEG